MAKELFNHSPQVGASSEAGPDIIVIKFGDGYEQRVQKGINNDLRTYSVSFNGRKEKVKEIEAFFSRHGGHKSFRWIAPDRDEEALFVCEKWRPGFVNGLNWQIDTSFREVVA